MKTPIDIISGFLGAGKTTLLNEMLQSVYKDKKIAIIENEFGDINIDVDLLPNDISVTEMTNGCACCTIRSGLIEAIKHLVDLRRFDRIVIEPSGIAKLSDIQSVIDTKLLREIAGCGVSVVVVNPFFHVNFSRNLGMCYQNQIENSDVIYLSRTDDTDEKIITDALSDLALMSKAKIITKISQDFLGSANSKKREQQCIHCGTEHNHDANDDETCHNHSHLDNGFITYTRDFSGEMAISKITEIIEEITEKSDNFVLRIKGIVQTDEGTRLIQWVPGEMNISKFNSDKNTIVIIEQV